ncbi:MAG: wax ester/triacylglycerol synthase domain-containing protein [Rhodococcus sp. (in: high G+C Gram-positive bacteria)]|uniref:wax ester/triacylglycerol synthase domain-containing protein n=1 Tax=Rhodococcus sp. TaxID=1831 RepID=UPI003BB6DD9B
MGTRRRGSAAPQLAPRDAVFFYGDEAGLGDTPSAMVHIYVFGGLPGSASAPTRRDAVTWVLERLDRTPSLRRRVQRVPRDLDYPYWIESGVDPDHHILFRHVGTTTRAALHDDFAAIAQRPFDFARPPWDMHVLADVRGVADLPEGATVVVFRVHHSVTDRQGAVQIARALFDDPAATPSQGGLPVRVAGGVAAALTLPVRYARFAKGIVGMFAARRALGTLVGEGAVSAPARRSVRTRFEVEDYSPRRFGRIGLDLAELRALARATGATVNDILVATISGAMDGYLEEHGEAPSESLTIQIPVSLAHRADIASENRTTTMCISLHTDEADPKTRLRSIHGSAVREKARVARPETFAVESLVDLLPSVGCRHTARKLARTKPASGEIDPTVMNTSLSNVARGQASDLSFAGRHAVEGFTVPPLNRCFGLMHGAVSLGDTLVLSFSAKSALLPDVEEYERFLADSFGRLRCAVIADDGDGGIGSPLCDR